MRIGVLSDIHGNILALKESVRHLEGLGCEEYFLLGDYISDVPYTRETLDYLYDFIKTHTCIVLRGNREEYMLDQHKAVLEEAEEEIWIRNSASGNLLYTYEALTEADFEFFEQLPISVLYRREGYPDILCCHGSPERSRELLQLDGKNTEEWLGRIDCDYLVCAHTHYPGMITRKGKVYCNSGSVGIAITDYGLAQCMMLESMQDGEHMKWVPTFFKVPYDNLQAAEKIKSCGLLAYAPWFVNSNILTLLTGIDRSALLVKTAAEIAKERGLSCQWPLVDEKAFEIAAERIGIPDYREE